ncbi:hypothetical protein AK88_05464 [Plasmodium fragile]|uniref:Schizont-infected cell agglutination C-terminal domain-containing protein n=1 Tax=Plasmodium fragile TaxID=5857 RepID=A0A0D9QD12_PLAFR|nr:uncharacterized protein AK88_05464 [Plasmodium fragile]KJP84903.1 hypothetical protein AK88_05464 [Plasmodium fragile]
MWNYLILLWNNYIQQGREKIGVQEDQRFRELFWQNVQTVWTEFKEFMEQADYDILSELCQAGRDAMTGRGWTAEDMGICEMALIALRFKHGMRATGAPMNREYKTNDEKQIDLYMRCILTNIFMKKIMGMQCLSGPGGQFAFNLVHGEIQSVLKQQVGNVECEWKDAGIGGDGTGRGEKDRDLWEVMKRWHENNRLTAGDGDWGVLGDGCRVQTGSKAKVRDGDTRQALKDTVQEEIKNVEQDLGKTVPEIITAVKTCTAGDKDCVKNLLKAKKAAADAKSNNKGTQSPSNVHTGKEHGQSNGPGASDTSGANSGPRPGAQPAPAKPAPPPVDNAAGNKPKSPAKPVAAKPAPSGAGGTQAIGTAAATATECQGDKLLEWRPPEKYVVLPYSDADWDRVKKVLQEFMEYLEQHDHDFDGLGANCDNKGWNDFGDGNLYKEQRVADMMRCRLMSGALWFANGDNVQQTNAQGGSTSMDETEEKLRCEVVQVFGHLLKNMYCKGRQTWYRGIEYAWETFQNMGDEKLGKGLPPGPVTDKRCTMCGYVGHKRNVEAVDLKIAYWLMKEGGILGEITQMEKKMPCEKYWQEYIEAGASPRDPMDKLLNETGKAKMQDIKKDIVKKATKVFDKAKEAVEKKITQLAAKEAAPKTEGSRADQTTTKEDTASLPSPGAAEVARIDDSAAEDAVPAAAPPAAPASAAPAAAGSGAVGQGPGPGQQPPPPTPPPRAPDHGTTGTASGIDSTSTGTGAGTGSTGNAGTGSTAAPSGTPQTEGKKSGTACVTNINEESTHSMYAGKHTVRLSISFTNTDPTSGCSGSGTPGSEPSVADHVVNGSQSTTTAENVSFIMLFFFFLPYFLCAANPKATIEEPAVQVTTEGTTDTITPSASDSRSEPGTTNLQDGETTAATGHTRATNQPNLGDTTMFGDFKTTSGTLCLLDSTDTEYSKGGCTSSSNSGTAQARNPSREASSSENKVTTDGTGKTTAPTEDFTGLLLNSPGIFTQGNPGGGYASSKPPYIDHKGNTEETSTVSPIPDVPDLTDTVLTATTPILFFLIFVTVALLGYSLWKYFAYLAKRRRTYRTIRDVPSPPLDEDILQHLQRGELPPPDYGYTMVTPPASTSGRARPPRVHKRTIIELHLEVLNECEETAWENVKDDYWQILVQEFAHDLEQHDDTNNNILGVSTSHDALATGHSTTLDAPTESDGIDPCPPTEHYPDPWSCIQYIQLDAEQNAHSNPEHGDATSYCTHWINWIDRNKHILRACTTQPWFHTLKLEWKQYYQQHSATANNGQRARGAPGNIPSADMTKLRLWREWVAQQHRQMSMYGPEEWFKHLLNNVEDQTVSDKGEVSVVQKDLEVENAMAAEDMLHVRDVPRSQSLHPQSYMKQLIAQLWMLLLASVIEECEIERSMQEKELYLDALLQQL